MVFNVVFGVCGIDLPLRCSLTFHCMFVYLHVFVVGRLFCFVLLVVCGLCVDLHGYFMCLCQCVFV